SGKALKKMKQIIRAQGGKITESSQIVLAKKKVQVRAKMEGEISKVNIRKLNKIARLAGAPADKKAGIMLNAREGDKIERGALLM
ncbi:MAG: thymidine phosphorylase, partial [Candidatus Diapherotrites archaeon]